MKVGLLYLVTHPSDDGTFETGDHIRLNSDGTITCRETPGWIAIEDVPEAIAGMRFELDVDTIQRRRDQLLAELNELMQ